MRGKAWLCGAAAVLGLTAAAFRAADAAPVFQLQSLAGSEWGLPGDDGVMIQFRAHRVTGFSGCNRFNGRYAYEAGYLTIGPLVVTRNGCAPRARDGERAFLAVLDDTRRATATHLVLTLRDGTGAALATLRRRDWD